MPGARIDKGFGYALRIDITLGGNTTLEESDTGKSRMRGGYCEQKFFVMFVFPLLAWEFAGGKGGHA